MVWGCMTWEGVRYTAKIDCRMDGDLYLPILKDELQNSLRSIVLILLMSFLSNTITQSIPERWSRSSQMGRNLGLWYVLHSLLTLSLWNISGITSGEGLHNISTLLGEYRSYKEELRRSGTRYQLRCVRHNIYIYIFICMTKQDQLLFCFTDILPSISKGAKLLQWYLWFKTGISSHATVQIT